MTILILDMMKHPDSKGHYRSYILAFGRPCKFVDFKTGYAPASLGKQGTVEMPYELCWKSV